MTNYDCKLCYYNTSRRGNYLRHIESKKHLKNVTTGNINLKIGTQSIPKVYPNGTPKKCSEFDKKNHMCQFCTNLLSNASSLARHRKTCSKRVKLIESHKKEISEKNYKNEVEKLKIENIHIIKERNYFQEELKYYKHLLREAGGLVKKSVSSLSFAVENYDSAPAIRTIDVNSFDELEKDKNKLVEDIISAYRHKTLNKYVGDFVVVVCKKDNPENQSIWNTDTSRLTYLIKELIKNKSSNWYVDKKGLKTKTYLIDPLLSKIKEFLSSYQQKICLDKSYKPNAHEIVVENNKTIIDIVNDIDDDVLAKDILKYIAPLLSFNSKLIKSNGIKIN